MEDKKEILVQELKNKYGLYIRDVRYSFKYYDVNVSYPEEPQEIERTVVEDISVIESIADFISQKLDKAREEGYEECKKDMAVGVGLAVDTDFSKIVSKIASKLTTK